MEYQQRFELLNLGAGSSPPLSSPGYP